MLCRSLPWVCGRKNTTVHHSTARMCADSSPPPGSKCTAKAPLEIDFVSGPRMGERLGKRKGRGGKILGCCLLCFWCRLLLTEQLCTIGRADTCTIQARNQRVTCALLCFVVSRSAECTNSPIARSATPCLPTFPANIAFCRRRPRVTCMQPELELQGNRRTVGTPRLENSGQQVDEWNVEAALMCRRPSGRYSAPPDMASA